MKFLGIKIDSHGSWNGVDDWRQIPAHIYCPADIAEEEMECLHYEPLDYVNWMCKFCDGDRCLKGVE